MDVRSVVIVSVLSHDVRGELEQELSLLSFHPLPFLILSQSLISSRRVLGRSILFYEKLQQRVRLKKSHTVRR